MAQPVSQARLESICGTDSDAKNELITQYHATLEDILARLKKAATHSAEEAWDKAIHELKGAAENLDASIVSELCYEATVQAPLSTDQQWYFISLFNEQKEATSKLMHSA